MLLQGVGDALASPALAIPKTGLISPELDLSNANLAGTYAGIQLQLLTQNL